MNQRADIYSRVTDRIITDLEMGVRPWIKPWNVEHAAGQISRPLRANGVAYQGVNVLLLWSEAVERGYVSPIWMTYKQALELGAHVRKGEHGATVVYADRFTKTETNEQGEMEERKIPFLKSYTVFNVEQIDELPLHYYAKPSNPLAMSERIENADRFVVNTGANVQHGGNRAVYSVTADRIQLPPFEAFKDAESYWATALHELTHWTRHPLRLNRDFGRQKVGDEGYAKEELVAELGAAFLCADLGISAQVCDDHAAYIAHWLEVLRHDKRFIFTAASHAQRAADHLHSLQARPQPYAEAAA